MSSVDTFSESDGDRSVGEGGGDAVAAEASSPLDAVFDADWRAARIPDDPAAREALSEAELLALWGVSHRNDPRIATRGRERVFRGLMGIGTPPTSDSTEKPREMMGHALRRLHPDAEEQWEQLERDQATATNEGTTDGVDSAGGGKRHTLVVFHAHPDDEAVSTSGVMAKAAADGHRVVLVVATQGEHGEMPDGYLQEGETLADRRVREAFESAEALGVARVAFLGYRDSGMAGASENDAPRSFWGADVDEAAGRLAHILRDEGADVLTAYDDHGTYGHPDHVKVHDVGTRAAELAGTPKLYWSTVDRDAILGAGAEEDADVDLDLNLGTRAPDITTTVDVSSVLVQKRAAIASHGSQFGEDSFFRAMPPALFNQAFGKEWFVRAGAPPGTLETGLFGGLY